MANQIRIDPSTMLNRAREYNQQGEVINGVISAMDGLLNNLQNEWEGSASEAYAEKYQELRPKFQEAKDLTDQIAKALTDTAQKMRDQDDAIARGFGA